MNRWKPALNALATDDGEGPEAVLVDDVVGGEDLHQLSAVDLEEGAVHLSSWCWAATTSPVPPSNDESMTRWLTSGIWFNRAASRPAIAPARLGPACRDATSAT